MSLLVGAIVGLGFAVGSLLIVRHSKRSSFVDQVMPHVRATGFDWSPRPAQRRSEVVKRAVRILDAFVTDESVRQRLERSRSPISVESFRLEQLKWSAAAAAGVVGFGVLRAMLGQPIPVGVWLFLCATSAVSAALARDAVLTRRASERVDRVNRQLPVFAELLAFTVAAGLAPASALNRVARRVGGELAEELLICGDEVASGRPFAEALESMADRIGSAEIRRFVDGIVVAIERGTPIADVLRAQAMDARSASHRALMEEASKREILALIPVVFLVLPVVVVVAVYPGFVGLVV